MKKLFRTFLAFLILAVGIEVVILICTKVVGWNNLDSGRPFLAAVHVHLMVLGAIFFLIQMILDKLFSITAMKFYKVFYIAYLIGLSVLISMIMYKGFAQLFNFAVITGITQALAAIAHTTLFVSLFFFVHCLYIAAVKNSGNTDIDSNNEESTTKLK